MSSGDRPFESSSVEPGNEAAARVAIDDFDAMGLLSSSLLLLSIVVVVAMGDDGMKGAWAARRVFVARIR